MGYDDAYNMRILPVKGAPSVNTHLCTSATLTSLALTRQWLLPWMHRRVPVGRIPARGPCILIYISEKR